MEKLISMTDFVLEQTELLYEKNQSKLIHNIVNYAIFLKQPLKLEMFVPCDEDGNVLNQKLCDFSKYEKAKEKVLFEGCSSMQQGENTIVIFNHTGIWYAWTNRTIEYLVKYNLTLTPNATKQFL